jgi:stromal membrane-associated protein
MVEFLGMLKVRIVRGINLAVRDLLSSDPYVCATLGGQSAKTKVVNRNLNPVWDEELMLSVPSPPQPLKLQVFDHDVFSKDDSMGEATVDLNPLILAAQMHQGMFEEFGCEQIGRWLATSDNALVKDSNIEVIDGLIKQEVHLKLQNVERGEIEVSLEWVPLNGL